MKTLTLQSRYAAGLRAMGYDEAESTIRYRIFTKKKSRIIFYLGLRGAIRFSLKNGLSRTYILAPDIRANILDAAPTYKRWLSQ